MENKNDKKVNRIKKRHLNSSKTDKVPSVSRIKSYYGFSKEYPGTVDEKGFRDVKKQGTPSEIKQKTKSLMIKAFVIVFIVSFAVTYICLGISKHPITADNIVTNADTENKTGTGKGYYISGQTAYNTDSEKLVADIKKLGADSVIIDAKDGAGYIYFKCDDITSVTASAIQYSQGNFASLLQKFTENSIKVSVLFSCFADTFEASYVSDMAVTEKNSEGLWYDNSASPHAWLNPYNNNVISYITKQLDRLTEYGADEIILTNVQIPYCTNFSSAVFGTDVTLDGVNAKMAAFVKSVADKYNGKCDISALCSFVSINNNSNLKNHLLDIKLKRIFIDMRMSVQPNNITIDTNKFENPSQKPYMFISNAVYASANIIDKSSGKSEFVPVIEFSSSVSDEEKAIKSHGVDSYYIYNVNSNYNN